MLFENATIINGQVRTKDWVKDAQYTVGKSKSGYTWVVLKNGIEIQNASFPDKKDADKYAQALTDGKNPEAPYQDAKDSNKSNSEGYYAGYSEKVKYIKKENPYKLGSKDYEDWEKGYNEYIGQYKQNNKDARGNTSHIGERQFDTYEAWKRAVKQIDPNVRFDGDKDICQGGNIGEWDGAHGIIYSKDTKDIKINETPDSEFDAKELALGIKTEMEHTDDKEEAKSIARDHLLEIPDYYTRLLKMEKELKENENK